MVATAFIFPGQGSQTIGMGRELAEGFASAREVFEEVDDSLNQKLSALMWSGAEDDLKLTENAQPAIMAVSMAVIRVLQAEGKLNLAEKVRFMAGHSLGEYSALCAAGAISLSDAARLLKTRGQAMQAAVPVGVGGMAALLGVDMEQAQKISAEAAQGEVCVAANDNAPGQVVISGHLAAIDRALALAAEQGFKRSVKLPVSAPFHCPLMEPAARVMATELAKVTINSPLMPIVANVTATAVQSPAEIRSLLVEQICGSVRWRESMLWLQQNEIEQVFECGAGKALAGMMKRIAPDMKAASMSTPQDIDTILNTI